MEYMDVSFVADFKNTHDVVIGVYDAEKLTHRLSQIVVDIQMLISADVCVCLPWHMGEYVIGTYASWSGHFRVGTQLQMPKGSLFHQ